MTYFWGLLPEQIAWFAFGAVGAIIGFIIIRPIQKRFDKKTILMSCMMLIQADWLTMINLRFLEVLPENGDPLLLILLILNTIFTTMISTLAGIVGPSIMADIVDQQELETNLRQEGIFFSALSFSQKSISGLGVIFGGLIIDFLGFPKGVKPDLIDPGVITRLGMTMGLALPLANFLPVSLFAFFKLSRHQHEAIRKELDHRRMERLDQENSGKFQKGASQQQEP
jgi:Na+/melibiose symporter-like transporter